MSTTSEAYLDIVTGVERAWPPAYDGAIMRDCPECHASKMELCINPIRGRFRKAPCLARMAKPLS
jgi:hypothetical protein